MKINRTAQKKGISLSPLFAEEVEAKAGEADFQQVLREKAEEAGNRRLKDLYDRIEGQGEILTMTRTLEDLQRFKRMVREFLDEALSQALRIEERIGSTPRGRVKVYRLVEQIDERLAKLTEAILEDQADGIGLLEGIGEIKGLLINYFV